MTVTPALSPADLAWTIANAIKTAGNKPRRRFAATLAYQSQAAEISYGPTREWTAFDTDSTVRVTFHQQEDRYTGFVTYWDTIPGGLGNPESRRTLEITPDGEVIDHPGFGPLSQLTKAAA